MPIYEVWLGIKYRRLKVKKKSKDFYVYHYLVFLKKDMHYFPLFYGFNNKDNIFEGKMKILWTNRTGKMFTLSDRFKRHDRVSKIIVLSFHQPRFTLHFLR